VHSANVLVYSSKVLTNRTFWKVLMIKNIRMS